MSQEKVRIGIIGVGQIAKLHLDNYAKLDTVEVVAAADINEAEVERVAEKYGIPNTYTDFRQAAERDDLDAVDVCLHNNLHMPVVVEVLRSGKHVYCEKPMAGAYIDAARMLDVAREVDRMLHIQTANLYFNETKVAKHLIDEGQLGKTLSCAILRSSPSRTSLCRRLRHAHLRAEAQFGRRRAL
jgi:predicted dehydrogenase